jgi:hypothetical protein
MKKVTEEQGEQLNLIKQVFDDKKATINGRDYEFKKMTHSERLVVFAYTTEVQFLMGGGNFGFLASDDFKRIMSIIESHVTVNRSLLSKSPDHWDEHPEDYMMFVPMALAVIGYPFGAGNATS